MRGRFTGGATALLIVGLAGYALIAGYEAEPEALPGLPAPIDSLPGEEGDSSFSRRREAWMNSMRLAAPGVDPAELDARYRAARDLRHQRQRELLHAQGAELGQLRAFESAAISGVWRERGSSNQSGRVVATLYDRENDRLNLLSHGGNLWRASRTLLNWSSPNDAASFIPSGAQGFIERLAGSAGERLLIVGDRPATLRFSDNGGVSFTEATGLSVPNPWYAAGLAVRDQIDSEVYLLRVHYDSTAPADWRTHLFASSNRGAGFSSQGFVGPRNQVALFSPPTGDNTMFLLAGTQLFTIAPGSHARLPRSTLPHSLAGNESVALSGGVTSGGQTYLYAFYSNPSQSQTRVYHSADAGNTWVARTPAPTSMFGLTSASSSPRDPTRVYVGGVEMYRSADGGAAWTRVNTWQEYYGAPAIRLHADICGIRGFIDGAGVERLYISTDGGVYESTDHAQTVQNLSLNGLNISQYYGSYTLRQAPFHISVGSQDQGYQKALSPPAGVQPFIQVISGDYAHLVSADGGQNTWSVYPTFAMLDTNPGAGNQSSLRTYAFSSAQLTGTLFLPPLAAIPGQPGRALLAGGRIGGGNAHTLIELSLSGSTISGVADPYDFVHPITAVAVSPHAAATRYVLATPGGAANPGARFFRRSGGGWAQTASSLPNGQFFYGARILPDPATPGRVYVAGSGYGAGNGQAVYVSEDDGLSFTPMSTGLPSTLVLGLAISSDGAHLFAAAETGAFYFDRAQQRWVDIVSAGAPNQTYWHVDYIDALGIARFSTYGRGLWDFELQAGSGLFANGFEP